ncbi:hypothetical protein BCD48_32205 [Pseudofrankia sp. BMG5.36]|nr:hypothetical protein BCD48_32205 [Pseudofrankia sp. BMG5.36]
MASVVETAGGLVPIDTASAFRPKWHRDLDGAEVESDVITMIGDKLYRKTPQSLVEAKFPREARARPV